MRRRTCGWRRHCLTEIGDGRLQFKSYNSIPAWGLLAGRRELDQQHCFLLCALFTGILVKGKEYYSNASRVESLARMRRQVRAATNTIVQLIVPKPSGASPFVGEVVKFRRRRSFSLCLLREPACLILPRRTCSPRLRDRRHPIHQRARPSLPRWRRLLPANAATTSH